MFLIISQPYHFLRSLHRAHESIAEMTPSGRTHTQRTHDTTHARTHARTSACTRTHRGTCAHAHARARTQARARTHTHGNTHTRTNARTSERARTHRGTSARARKHSRPQLSAPILISSPKWHRGPAYPPSPGFPAPRLPRLSGQHHVDVVRRRQARRQRKRRLHALPTREAAAPRARKSERL